MSPDQGVDASVSNQRSSLPPLLDVGGAISRDLPVFTIIKQIKTCLSLSFSRSLTARLTKNGVEVGTHTVCFVHRRIGHLQRVDGWNPGPPQPCGHRQSAR